MIKVNKDGKYILISLEEYVEEYFKEIPEGWSLYIEECVNKGMNIQNNLEHEAFLKKMNLKWFDYKSVEIFYHQLKESKYNRILDDDILRFIAFIYGLGYFERINYHLDISNPNLDTWLSVKNIFQPSRDKIPVDEGFALIELIPLKNGRNALKHQLMFSLKW